jgi:diadenosine tetraphosphatase ApaH/serine/threonine PP2A family protein phosphatase
MKAGIISDIHGNLEALLAVERELNKLGVDEVWCLGDVVGYGPNPNECVAKVQEMCRQPSGELVIVFGNHDEASLGGDISFFNPRAQTAALWTRSELSAESEEFLGSLPLSLERSGALLVHASPYEPGLWHYIMGIHDAAHAFDHFDHRICFVGHSHYPLVAELDGTVIRVVEDLEIKLQKKNRYLVNVGSVGQPRDRDPRACFVVYQPEKGLVTFCRAEYDVAACQEKILKAGLPAMLAERLEIGF